MTGRTTLGRIRSRIESDSQGQIFARGPNMPLLVILLQQLVRLLTGEQPTSQAEPVVSRGADPRGGDLRLGSESRTPDAFCRLDWAGEIIAAGMSFNRWCSSAWAKQGRNDEPTPTCESCGEPSARKVRSRFRLPLAAQELVRNLTCHGRGHITVENRSGGSLPAKASCRSLGRHS